MMAGCKKDRLSSNTYTFQVTPPATSIHQGVAKTFTAEGVADNGAFGADAEWTITPPTANTSPSPFPLYGASVTVTFLDSTPGGLMHTLTATYEDKSATTQVLVNP